ncbi:serine/threonine protein kinase, FIKK family, putative [Plasmodium gaboni]|uniref:Serine/threonine protein kinase, FIKK family, putative n=1 Tax=Plasmodium gaboni TaxID=647221 RepID=A0ABY0KWA4_9APIC|nr:serine/threonine protein kinase, FIKK family, putative [Plasmodium gaboni]
MMQIYNGEFIENGENFVMKAICIENINDINIFNNLLREYLKMNMTGYVFMISEFFGEDLENYIYNIHNNKTYKFKKK